MPRESVADVPTVEAPPEADSPLTVADPVSAATPPEPEHINAPEATAATYKVSLIPKVTAQVNALADPNEPGVDQKVEHTVVALEGPVAITLGSLDRTPDGALKDVLDEHGRIVISEDPVTVPKVVADELASQPYVKVEAV